MRYETGLQIDQAPPWVIATFTVVWLLSSAWIVKDSVKRGKSPVTVFLFHTLAGWPLSIVWWILLRPDVESKYEQKKEGSEDSTQGCESDIDAVS